MAYNPNLGRPEIPAQTDSEWGFEQSEFDFNVVESPLEAIRLISEPRISVAQYNLGGNPNELSDGEVLNLADHGLISKRGRKLLNRRTDVEADREHFGMTGSEELSLDQLNTLGQGVRYALAEHRRHRAQFQSAQAEPQFAPLVIKPWE